MGLVEKPYLDLSDRVGSNGIEQGMLGLHPADAGRFFVYHVDTNGHRTLSEFQDPSPERERPIFSHPQPPDSVEIRHYGGNPEFGPDGYLYVSLGDGGWTADLPGVGQPNALGRNAGGETYVANHSGQVLATVPVR